MAVFQGNFFIATRGNADTLNITAQVSRVVADSKVDIGIVHVSGVGSTLGITTLEFEPGCVADLKEALDRIAPAITGYAHNERWGDENGYSHLRSALMGTVKSFPIAQGRILLGAWQQIVLCDFDDRARDRQVIVTVLGE